MRTTDRTILALSLVTLFLALGCSGGGASSVDSPTGPDGESLPFLPDNSEGGATTALRLVETSWGRLVDVHDVDASGQRNPEPIYRDFVVRESLIGDGQNLELETNPITQKTRLIVKRTRADNPQAFDRELDLASDPMSPVRPLNDDGSSAPPFSLVARNAALVLRFNDVLDASSDVERNLSELVRIKVGYPPETPFAGRTFFDRNHGALVRGVVHPTRIIVDLTVSEAEASVDPGSLALNPTGLPPSLPNAPAPNVSIRIPTEVAMGMGQFHVLRALSGAPIGTEPTEPSDRIGATRDLVRAFRSGNDDDVNRGVMSDFALPEVVGTWPMRIMGAADDPGGSAGFDFILDMRFDTVCQRAPSEGDILQINSGRLLEVRRPGQSPGANGAVKGILVRSVTDQVLDNPLALISGGVYLSTLDGNLPIPRACWIDVTPQPKNFPSGGVSTQPQIGVRFTEPMRPGSVTPFQSFMLIKGSSSVPPQPSNIIVGRIAAAEDLRSFSYSPVLELTHVQGQIETYSVRIDGATDFAGNPLLNRLSFIDLHVDSEASSQQSAGTVFRFNELDEVAPIGFDDLRGQFFHDSQRGTIRPRPVTFFGKPVDDSNPVPSIMVPFARPIQTPLSAFGSKLQAVWRYADLGWQVADETRHNIDVVGLNWTPLDGLVISDIFPEFEIVLSHSRRLPDEAVDGANLPRHPNSGLVGSNNFFTDNILNDPLSPPKIVHPRSLGYIVDPANLFLSSSGKTLMPYPMNQGAGSLTSFTWRDTAVLARGGPGGNGIPMSREVGTPLSLEPGPAGRYARANDVPSYGLPLLMEFRTFPNGGSLGLNGFRVALAINSAAIPAMRSFSTGGTNTAQQLITRHPDLEDRPRGGFDPLSTPTGRATPANDNSLYPGQLDFVTRISRAHTVWVDTSSATARFFEPVVQPPRSEQPPGTDVVLEYRGATGFSFVSSEDGNSPFNARALDPYGEMFRVDNMNRHQHVGTIRFVNDTPTWSRDIHTIDGARFFQIRMTFFNNIESGQNPELRALGFAYHALR